MVGDAAAENVPHAGGQLAGEAVRILISRIPIVMGRAVENQIVRRPLRNGREIRGGARELHAGISIEASDTQLERVVISADEDAIITRVLNSQALHVPEVAVEREAAAGGGDRLAAKIVDRNLAVEGEDLLVQTRRAIVANRDSDADRVVVGSAAHPDRIARGDTGDRVFQRGWAGLRAWVGRTAVGGNKKVARRWA